MGRQWGGPNGAQVDQADFYRFCDGLDLLRNAGFNKKQIRKHWETKIQKKHGITNQKQFLESKIKSQRFVPFPFRRPRNPARYMNLRKIYMYPAPKGARRACCYVLFRATGCVGTGTQEVGRSGGVILLMDSSLSNWYAYANITANFLYLYLGQGNKLNFHVLRISERIVCRYMGLL